jgi:lipopolysaccharide/colanic/teichoic acid biosynthesis glycosyltransferase
MKRLFDYFVAFFGLAFLFPFFIIIGILVKMGSPGSIFYRGIRTGQCGKPFRIYKFRTMFVDAEKKGGFSTAENDPRLTNVGAFLRKFKFDELPQLINILRGEMSFVGPRPQVEHYTKLYDEDEKIILSVKPGITDYASIKFINLDNILGNHNVDEKYRQEIEPEKNRLRIKYAKEHTFWIDCKILLSTFLQFLRVNSLWNTKS